MEEDVLILLGVAFNLNLPLLTAWLLDHWLGDPLNTSMNGCSTIGWATRRGCPIRLWLSAKPFLSVSTG